MSWLLWLLIAAPVAIGASFLHAPPLVIFAASAIAIIPLSGLLGHATEELSAHTGPTLGGLVNASLGNLAELEFRAGDVERALTVVREALEITIRGKNALILAIDHTNLAAYSIAAGDLEAARVAAREGLKWAQQGQHALGIAIVLQHLALIAALCNDVNDGARLIGYVDARFTVLSYEREYTERWCLEKLMVALRERLSESDIEQLAAEGAAWTEDHAVEQAMSV